MTVRLFDAYYNIATSAVAVLSFANGEVNGLNLVMAVPNHPAFIVDYVPAILRFIMVDVEGVL
jgi:hypothetical protein